MAVTDLLPETSDQWVWISTTDMQRGDFYPDAKGLEMAVPCSDFSNAVLAVPVTTGFTELCVDLQFLSDPELGVLICTVPFIFLSWKMHAGEDNVRAILGPC